MAKLFSLIVLIVVFSGSVLAQENRVDLMNAVQGEYVNGEIEGYVNSEMLEEGEIDQDVLTDEGYGQDEEYFGAEVGGFEEEDQLSNVQINNVATE